jgi:hypothetical protein
MIRVVRRLRAGIGVSVAMAVVAGVGCAFAAGCGSAGAGEAPEDPGDPMASSTDTALSGPTALSPAQVADGWRLLFDGRSLDGWRGYGMDRAPGGWTAEDGVLRFTPGIEGGDLLHSERFSDFELALEWRIEEGGNSGIFFHVVEDYDWAFESGPEMQILDDAHHPDGANPLTSAGSNYALHAPVNPSIRPVGEWNEVRIRVEGPRVEHWLNGSKIVEYERWTDEWTALVAASKFAEMPGYGLAREGHIDLQDHGDPVWFRNIRVRVLD